MLTLFHDPVETVLFQFVTFGERIRSHVPLTTTRAVSLAPDSTRIQLLNTPISLGVVLQECNELCLDDRFGTDAVEHHIALIRRMCHDYDPFAMI
jgi:hypothetical protein